MRAPRSFLVAVVLLTGIASAACGGAATPAPVPTVTVTQSPTENSTTPSPTDTPTPTPAAATTAASMIVVPNGVGKDYQTAQDLWRGAGLHVLPATDALGLHRLPIIDSNWVVVSQDLKAGSKVPADSLITATVKKFTDG